jgi:hypothetical protein
MIVVSSRHDDVTEYARVAEHSKIVKGELSDAFIPYQVQCRH